MLSDRGREDIRVKPVTQSRAQREARTDELVPESGMCGRMNTERSIGEDPCSWLRLAHLIINPLPSDHTDMSYQTQRFSDSGK